MTNIQPDVRLAHKPIISAATLEHGAIPISFVRTFQRELGMLLDRCEMQFQRPSTNPDVPPSLAKAVVGLSAVLGYRESAKEWLERYARLAEDATSFTSVATHQLRVAHLRTLLGDPTGAIQALVRVREVLAHEDRRFSSWHIAHLGLEYYRLGRVNEAQATWRSINHKDGRIYLADALLAASQLELRSGQFADAILLLRSTFSIAEGVASYPARFMIYRQLHTLAVESGATELRRSVLNSLETYAVSSEDVEMQTTAAADLFRYKSKESAQRLMWKVIDKVEKTPSRRLNLDGSTVDYEREFQVAKGCAAVGITGRYNGHLDKLRFPELQIQVLETVCEAKIISRRPEREVIALAKDIEKRKQEDDQFQPGGFQLDLAFLYCRHGQPDRALKHLRSVPVEDLISAYTPQVFALAVEAGGTEIAAAFLNGFFNGTLDSAKKSEANSPYALLRLSDVMLSLAGFE